MEIKIEFYFKDNTYCAYIGEDGASGIEVNGATPEELSQNIAPYLADYAINTDKVEELVDGAIQSAIDGDYITENSSYKEVEDNSFEILEFINEDLTDKEWEYAEQYLLEQYK